MRLDERHIRTQSAPLSGRGINSSGVELILRVKEFIMARFA